MLRYFFALIALVVSVSSASNPMPPWMAPAGVTSGTITPDTVRSDVGVFDSLWAGIIEEGYQTTLPVFALSTSDTVSGYAPGDSMQSPFISGTSGSGVLFSSAGSKRLTAIVPYGVVIGNSIGLNAANNYGRLCQAAGDCSVNLSKASGPGQIDYELGTKYGWPWINNAIDGNTLVQMRLRFARDVLGKDTTGSDGRTSNTMGMVRGLIPRFLFLEGGTNDATQGTDLDSTRDAIRYMVQRAVDNGIDVMLMGPGAKPNWGANLSRAQAIYNFMKDTILVEYPQVMWFDFLAFSTGGTMDWLTPRPGLYYDNTHPTLAGGIQMAAAIDSVLGTYNYPRYLLKTTLNNKVNGRNNTGRPSNYTFAGHSYQINRMFDQYWIDAYPIPRPDSARYSFDVSSYDSVMGAPTSIGWASITQTFTSVPVVRPVSASGETRSANGGISINAAALGDSAGNFSIGDTVKIYNQSCYGVYGCSPSITGIGTNVVGVYQGDNSSEWRTYGGIRRALYFASGGTRASPSPLSDGSGFTPFTRFYMYNGSGFTRSGDGWNGLADGTTSSTNSGQNWYLEVVDSASNTRYNAIQVRKGRVTFGKTAALAASTTSYPSIIFPSGTRPTSPTAGAQYISGDSLYYYNGSSWRVWPSVAAP